jgi:hypothetical protein
MLECPWPSRRRYDHRIVLSGTPASAGSITPPRQLRISSAARYVLPPVRSQMTLGRQSGEVVHSTSPQRLAVHSKVALQAAGMRPLATSEARGGKDESH